MDGVVVVDVAAKSCASFLPFILLDMMQESKAKRQIYAYCMCILKSRVFYYIMFLCMCDTMHTART